MTPQEWQRFESKLSHALGWVRLRIDGYEVDFRVEPVKRLKYQIMTYVDGKFQGRWLLEDCEVRRKFMRPRNTYACSARERKKLKQMGKRALRELGIDPDRKITHYTPLWSSPKSLKSHLRKTCQNIEFIE